MSFSSLFLSLSFLQTSSTMSLISEPSLEPIPISANTDSTNTLLNTALLSPLVYHATGYNRDLPGLPTPGPLEVLHIEEEGSSSTVSVTPGYSVTTPQLPSVTWLLGPSHSEVAAVSATCMEQMASVSPVQLSKKSDSSKETSQCLLASRMEFLPVPMNTEAWSEGLDETTVTEKEQRAETKLSTVSVSDTGMTGQAKVQTTKESEQRSLFRDNSAFPSQKEETVETTLDKLWALELAMLAPEVHAENNHVVTKPVCESPIVALDRWDIFPDTKSPLGLVAEQGPVQNTEVQHESKANVSPDLGQRRQGRDRTRKYGPHQSKPGEGQEGQHFRSSATTPETPENVWKDGLDLLTLSTPPVQRISASGQAGIV